MYNFKRELREVVHSKENSLRVFQIEKKNSMFLANSKPWYLFFCVVGICLLFLLFFPVVVVDLFVVFCVFVI